MPHPRSAPFLLALSLLAGGCTTPAPPAAPKPGWALAVHGGAGVMDRETMSAETEATYRAALQAALNRGTAVLDKGGSALDAVEAVVRGLEDDPLFNAGRGAVFTADGRNELDAAIMDGGTLKAGAVAGITGIRNPITLARAVMEQSPHVMMIGQGAERFGAEKSVEKADPSWFFTEKRWQSLKKTLTERGLPIPPRPPGVGPEPVPLAQGDGLPEDRKFGTVGVVARDRAGHVAAGTSTGGTTAKLWGRVGDSPIIGAGTYADDKSCAVSGTGTGEYFIRLGVAREVCNLVGYGGKSLQQAADAVIQKQLTALGGDGGVIAVAADGTLAWSFNTSGMYRAMAAEGQKPVVAIFKGEP
ncbi:isoaspartyl peptidase/L-asparaginase [Niveispirillum sp. SYP-B3756]|uniref:isoaspartyl peptidase/L-asparaginase family protein n=1 Tax=Niveispirillum sp. SYP-B3756 TaxID=2662178 RepID=UPI001292AFC6|nr:isoaspartyl peptidase/L-asparaginase [Niveispirillum sp. SYP-B3756]MQP65279.1 isoaspartyl peptidase/L-asparaginase [Niveispirillum sp. SYP-B3756]